ncbi:MAG: porin family protein [Oleiphilaceae bacterium]|nr:porin family protein [Oleiphilaceae bacterium]
MNRIPALIIAMTALTVAAAPAIADMYKSGGGNLYAGANYTFVDVDVDNGGSADLGTLSGKVGGYITPYFGLEARAGFGVDDDRIGAGTDLEADNFFGGYATVNVVNESPFTPYGIIGFTRYELESSGFQDSSDEDESGLSYGIGANMVINETLSGNLEYMRYLDEDDFVIDGIGLGLTLNF